MAAYATISINWNETSETLTIGKRQGEFPGMLNRRIFNIVMVGENHGTGDKLEAIPDKKVIYTGDEIVVRL